MNRRMFSVLLAIAFYLCGADARSEGPASKSYYLIGNSLTWDTLPGALDGDVQWHVDCAKSLPFIYANPDAPCVKTSVLWPKALKEKQYDFVSVQPHYGSTLQEDVETISKWMELQPKAVFVIHSGWAHHENRANEFASFDPYGEMQHSQAYLGELLTKLRELHPDREFRQTRAIHLLEKIAEDVAAHQAPFADINEIHRDVIHMKHESGKYLMHNAMRHALGQPMSSKGFDKMDPQVKQYLDRVLSLLSIADSDQKLLAQILSSEESVDRSALIMKVSNEALKHKLSDALAVIEAAAHQRHASEPLEAEILEIGGKLYFEATGPEWIYLATDNSATDVFKKLVGIDLYNGNNPLKGRGGKNEKVTNDWLVKISGLSSLKKLVLSNCLIDDAGMHHLSKLADMRELDLTLTPVTDVGLAHLGTLTELRSLGLASTQCTGSGFTHLKSLDKLENVNFHFTPLNDAGLAAIAEVGVSGRLWFAHTHFTDDGAMSLSKLTNLRRCGIGSKEQASTGGAVAALVNLPLEDLSLLDNQASPVGVAHASKIQTLRRLDVSYGPQVEDASLALLAAMPRLQELKIGSAQVTDEGLQALASSKSLKKVSLENLKNVTAEGITRLQKSNPELVIEVK